MPIIYFSCTSPPPASHVWGPGLIVSRQWRRSSFASSRRAREWPWQVVSMGEKCHEGSCCHHPLPLHPTRETPPLSSTPLAPLVRIVREIAGRLQEEVKVNLWIGKYSGQKPESKAWWLKLITVVKTFFDMFLKCEGSMLSLTNSKDTANNYSEIFCMWMLMLQVFLGIIGFHCLEGISRLENIRNIGDENVSHIPICQFVGWGRGRGNG